MADNNNSNDGIDWSVFGNQDSGGGKSDGIDWSVFGGGDNGGSGAASATATMPKPAIDFTKFLTKPLVESGDMLMNMARTAGGAAGETMRSIAKGDVMSPISAINQGAAKGALGLIDQASNFGNAMNPFAQMAGNAAAHAVNPNAAPPQHPSLAAMFNQFNPAPQGFQNTQGVGEFIGQGAAPGMAIAKGAGGVLTKLAEAIATGEAYGAGGDISQRYADNKQQDLLASLYQGLPMALTAGALHTGIHALDKGAGMMRGGKETGEATASRDIAQQIDDMFPAGDRAQPRNGARELLDQFPPEARDQAITPDQLQRHDVAQQVEDLMSPQSKDMMQTYDDMMQRDRVQRQIDDIFNQHQPEQQSPETAIRDILRSYGVDPMQEAVRTAQDRMAPNPSASGTGNEMRVPGETRGTEEIPRTGSEPEPFPHQDSVPPPPRDLMRQLADRMQVNESATGTKNKMRGTPNETRGTIEPPHVGGEPTPLPLRGDYAPGAEPQAESHELPPMVQALLDAKADAGEPERLRGFNQYQRRVEESKKQPAPPQPEGTGKPQEIRPDTSAREALATGPSWGRVTAGELAKHYPATADRPGVKKMPDQNKLAMVDKAGNTLRGKDGKKIEVSYTTKDDTILHSAALSRFVDRLKEQGHTPINDASARLAAEKANPPAKTEGSATAQSKPGTSERPSKTQPKEPVKQKGEFPRTGYETPASAELENKQYEKWRPEPEQKELADANDKERRSAKQAFIQHRFEELAHEHPNASRKIDEEYRADKKENPDSKWATSQTSEKYRAQFGNEFDNEFDKQLRENPKDVTKWLADKQKFHSEGAKAGKEIRKPSLAKKAIDAVKELVADEAGSSDRLDNAILGRLWLDPLMENLPAVGEKMAEVTKHFEGELSPQALKRLAGMQTNSDIVRQYDSRFSAKRNKFLADLDHASVDVEDPRTQEGKDAWREVMKTGNASDKLDANTNRYLQKFKQISDQYVDGQLKPRIKELEDAGVKEGLTGKGRLLRILKDDVKQLRGAPGDDEFLTRFLREARGGYFRSIFLGNHEVAGLHAIEAITAGMSHDPGAMTQAMGLASKAFANKALGKKDITWDYMNAFKTRGMETHSQDSELSSLPVVGDALKAGQKLNDAITKKIEKLPGGATAIDFMRAQLPEKMKIQTIRVAMTVRAAGELKYPGGSEGLMKDILDSARHKTIPPARQVLLDKARVQIYNDMNRLVMYSPLGFSEKTLFQRHGEMVKMLFPFTRSVVQQARLLHSYGEDMIKATGDAMKNPLDLKAHGRFMQAAGRVGTMLGMTAIYAGAKAIPKEADDELRKHHPQAYKDLHQALDQLHDLLAPGQTVEHLQPKLTAFSAGGHSQGGIFDSVKKIASDLSSNKKTATQKARAATAAAAFFQIDSVMGLVGSQKAFSFFSKLGDGLAGRTTKYAFSEEGKYLGKRSFKTDAESEILDWFMPGVPDVVSRWIQQKQDADFRRHQK